jgi:hypothetical protein
MKGKLTLGFPHSLFDGLSTVLCGPEKRNLTIFTFAPCMLLYLFFENKLMHFFFNTHLYSHLKHQIVKKSIKHVIKKPYMFRSPLYDHPQGSSFVFVLLLHFACLLRPVDCPVCGCMLSICMCVRCTCLWDVWLLSLLFVRYVAVCCLYVCVRCTCLWDVRLLSLLFVRYVAVCCLYVCVSDVPVCGMSGFFRFCLSGMWLYVVYMYVCPMYLFVECPVPNATSHPTDKYNGHTYT